MQTTIAVVVCFFLLVAICVAYANVIFRQFNQITNQNNTIMSVISDFVAKQQAFNAQLSTDVDTVTSSVTDLTSDIQALNDKITALQNSSGEVTPEDQALIDQLVSDGTALASKADAAANAVKALSVANSPAIPAVL